MINKENILNLKVSFQKTAFAPLTHELSITDVLRGIKEKRLEYIISDLRKRLSIGDQEGYEEHKKKLPGVTFSGTFNEKRKRSELKDYNQVIVLDIDKLTPFELSHNKQVLQEDSYVISFWESPSQKGLKGLVYLGCKTEITDIDLFHRVAFKKLTDYFQLNYEIKLDESGCDTTRLCFLSSDFNIVIKEKVCAFIINDKDIEKYSTSIKSAIKCLRTEKTINKVNNKNALFNAKGKNKPQNRLIIKSITNYLSKRNLSITYTYEEWYRVGFAISNSFTYDIGEGYFLKLCQQDKYKYNETECKNLLINCYETTNSKIKFNTIFYYAQQLGYKSKNKKGVSSEDV